MPVRDCSLDNLDKRASKFIEFGSFAITWQTTLNFHRPVRHRFTKTTLETYLFFARSLADIVNFNMI